jgi:hypothetical protein
MEEMIERGKNGMLENWNDGGFKVKLLTSNCLLSSCPTANWRLPTFFCALRFALYALPSTK